MKASILRLILLSLTLYFGNTAKGIGQPSCRSTEFRQEFLVGNGRQFTAEELERFETVYQRLTPEFSPDLDSNTKVTSICEVTRQVTRHSSLLEEIRVVGLYYTMTYESFHYNVTNYPMLFQNWTMNNLDTVLLKLQTVSLNVTGMFVPKRPLILKDPSTTELNCPATSASPTLSPTTSLSPTSPTTLEPTSDKSKPYNMYLCVALPVAIILMVV